MPKVKKCWRHLQQADVISFFVRRKCHKNPENQWKSMKIANINREILHNFSTTWGVSMRFSWKMWLMIIAKMKWNLTLNKLWNWSSCTKSNLSASWTHVGMEVQLGLLRTQPYYGRYGHVQKEVPFLAKSVTLVSSRKFGLLKLWLK